MKIKWWQNLSFFIIIVVTTFLVFPYERTLVSIYIDSGMLRKAHISLDKLLKKSPEDSRLFSLLSDVYQREGKSEKAIEALKKAILYEPNNLSFQERLAILYEWDRDLLNALSIWEQIIEKDPEHIKALKRAIGFYRYLRYLKKESVTIAKLVLLQNRFGLETIYNDFLFTLMFDDLQKFAKIRLSVNDDPNLDVILGKIFLLTKQYKADIEKTNLKEKQDSIKYITIYLDLLVRTSYIDMALAFAASLDKHQNSGIKIRLLLVKILYWNEMNKQVRDMLSKLKKTYSENQLIISEIAKIKKEIGIVSTKVSANKSVGKKISSVNTKENFIKLKQAVLLSNGDNKVVKQMLKTAENTGDSNNIEKAFYMGSKKRPHDQKFALKKAKYFLSENKQEEAILTLETFLTVNPDSKKVRKELKQIYLMNANLDKAYKHALYIVKQNGNKYNYLELMKIAEQGGFINKGFKIAQKLYKKYPTDLLIQTYLIKFASWNNKPSVVALVLSNIANKDLRNFKKTVRAGNAWIDAGQLDKGIIYLEKALALQPDNIHLRKNLIKYYGWTGSTQQMAVALEQLKNKNSLNKQEQMTLAQIYMDNKQWEKVIKLYKHLYNSQKIPIQAGLMLASAYEMKKKKNMAINIYKKLASENKNNSALLSKIGNHALWLENTKVALQFFEYALKQDSLNLIAIKGSGQIYAWNNDAQKAIERFEAYNKLNPNDYEVRYQLGELYSTNNRKDAAFKEYQYALQLINSQKKNKQKKNKR